MMNGVSDRHEKSPVLTSLSARGYWLDAFLQIYVDCIFWSGEAVVCFSVSSRAFNQIVCSFVLA